MEKTFVHPCLRCGACCAYFRVAFYWQESVPEELTEDLDGFRKNMRGTNKKHGVRCVGLGGTIGEAVKCTIYESRPTPCRDFSASFENGVKNPRCDKAREAHGLPPLKRADWDLPGPPVAC